MENSRDANKASRGSFPQSTPVPFIFGLVLTLQLVSATFLVRDVSSPNAATVMQRVFGAPRALIGMLHVRALPGAPRHALALDEIVATAIGEAKTYRESGFDALMIENMHDLPYLKGAVPPETIVSVLREVGFEAARYQVVVPGAFVEYTGRKPISRAS